MKPPEEGAAQRRQFERIPLPIRVHLEFREQRCFLSESVADISPGGMFVRSESPRSPGDRFDFEARLTDRGPPLSGSGVVVWTRGQEQGQPPGMGTRFEELDDGGHELLQRLIDAHASGGPEGLQREIEAAAEAWDEKVSEEDSTVSVPAPEPAPPLPDTEVIRMAEALSSKAEPEGETEAQPRLAADPALESPDDAPPLPDGGEASGGTFTELMSVPPPLAAPATNKRVEGADGFPDGPEDASSAHGTASLASTESRTEPVSTVDLQRDDDSVRSETPEAAAQAKTRGGLRWGRIAVLAVLGLLLLGAGLLWPQWSLLGNWEEWLGSSDEPSGLEHLEAVRVRSTVDPTEPEFDGRVGDPGDRGEESPSDAEGSTEGGPEERDGAPAARAVAAAAHRPDPDALRVIRSLERRASGEGLLIGIRLDGPIGGERLRQLRLDDPLRVVVVLAGISQRYAGEPPELDPSKVSGVRLGFHQGEQGPEQHIVFDLADPAVELQSLRETSDGVEVLLSRSSSNGP